MVMMHRQNFLWRRGTSRERVKNEVNVLPRVVGSQLSLRQMI